MTLNELARRSCRPRKETDRLDAQQINDGLAALPGWRRDESHNGIGKEFRFADYYRTIAFVNALAYIAHREDHHPDLQVGYNRCQVIWTTHDTGGLSENDLICAAKTEQLVTPASV